MKLKNLLAILLVVCMLTALFAACNKTDDGKTDPTEKVSSSPSGEKPSQDVIEEIVEINYWMFLMGADMPDAGEVEEAINEITEREIGVRVNFNRISFADYGTQLKLAIGNKEAIDLASYSPMVNLTAMYIQGAAMDITDILSEHGKELTALLGDEILSTTTVGGRVYGVSNYRILNSNTYIIYRKDALEAAGVLSKAENMTTWAEFEEVLEAVSGGSQG